MSTPTSVYRFYDADGRVIYIGMTGRGILRQGQHNASADWWRFVASQEVEHVDTRAEALRREQRLIERFRPPFNKEHNPAWRRIRAAYLVQHAPEGPDDDYIDAWGTGYDEGCVQGRHALRNALMAQVLADRALRMVIDGDDAVRRPGYVSVGLSAIEERDREYAADARSYGAGAIVELIEKAEASR